METSMAMGATAVSNVEPGALLTALEDAQRTW